MNRLTSCIRATALLLAGVASVAADVVDRPLEEALGVARESNRPLLVTFLGTDWSVACGKFSRAVLDTPEFRQWADANVVYYPVSARRKPKLSSEEVAMLQSLVIHFDVKSYPTVLLIDPDGGERLRHGYLALGAQQYIAALAALLPKDARQQSATAD